eukprot:3537701-Rhodomonas_salina.2
MGVDHVMYHVTGNRPSQQRESQTQHRVGMMVVGSPDRAARSALDVHYGRHSCLRERWAAAGALPSCVKSLQNPEMKHALCGDFDRLRLLSQHEYLQCAVAGQNDNSTQSSASGEMLNNPEVITEELFPSCASISFVSIRLVRPSSCCLQIVDLQICMRTSTETETETETERVRDRGRQTGREGEHSWSGAGRGQLGKLRKREPWRKVGCSGAESSPRGEKRRWKQRQLCHKLKERMPQTERACESVFSQQTHMLHATAPALHASPPPLLRARGPRGCSTPRGGGRCNSGCGRPRS